ncbi:hypothetical protein EBS02_06815, partial [bacterium]|nr:hypothetical protein [bacterium]
MTIPPPTSKKLSIGQVFQAFFRLQKVQDGHYYKDRKTGLEISSLTYGIIIVLIVLAVFVILGLCIRFISFYNRKKLSVQTQEVGRGDVPENV